MATGNGKKRGPRTHEEKMTHQLMMMAEIASACPPLGDLIENVAQNAITPEDIEGQLAAVRADLELGQVTIGAGGQTLDAIDRVVKSADHFSEASAKFAMINQASIAIDSARRTVQAEMNARWEDLKASVLVTARPIAPPIIEVACELVAAGVTGKQIRNTLIRDRIKRALIGPIGIASAVSQPVITQPTPRPLPELRAKWQTLPNPVPGYQFREREYKDTGSGPRDLAFYLPPFTSLDEIAPGTGLQLRQIESSRERYALALKTMRSWAQKNRYIQAHGNDVTQMRAWCFLLGYVHDFLDGIKELNKLTLVSPWSDMALVVERV